MTMLDAMVECDAAGGGADMSEEVSCRECLYGDLCNSPNLGMDFTNNIFCGILTIDGQLRLLDATNPMSVSPAPTHFDVEVTCTADASASCDDRGKPSAMCFSLGACEMLRFGSVKAI